MDDVRADVSDVNGQIVGDGVLEAEIPLLDVAGAGGTVGGVDALAEAGVGREWDGGDRGAGGELEGLIDAVEGLLLDVLDEGELGKGEGGGDAGLVDEDDAEAGAGDGPGSEEIGEADTGSDVVPMGLAGGPGVAIYTCVVKLLRGEVEDGTLVVFFGGREVEGVAGTDVEGELIGGAEVILEEVLLDVVAGAELGGLEVDGEGIDLAEEKAGDGVAGAGDALLVGAGGGEGEGAGGVGRGDGVELVEAEVEAGFDGVAAAGVNEGVGSLPDGGLVLGEGAGGGAELLEAGEGEERQGVVEGGVGGDAGDAEGGGGGVAECGAGDAVAAAGVAEAVVVDQMRGEKVWVSLKTACWPRTLERPRTPPVPMAVPEMAPEPSGNGVTGFSTSEK